MSEPRCGIALALYRPDVGYLATQLQTLVEQTHENWFCAITADSDLDELRSEPALARFFQDSRFDWHQNQNRLGFKKNFEAAIRRALTAGARYIACCDQDDLWYPSKLITLSRALGQTPSASLVHCDMDVITGDRRLHKSGWQLERRTIHETSFESFLLRNIVTGAAAMMHAELAERYINVPDGFRFHDWWFATAASRNGGVWAVPIRLYAYRQHAGNVVGNGSVERQEDVRAHWWDLRQRLGENVTYWMDVQARAAACEANGLPLTDHQKQLFLSKDTVLAAFAPHRGISLQQSGLRREMAFGKLWSAAGIAPALTLEQRRLARSQSSL